MCLDFSFLFCFLPTYLLKLEKYLENNCIWGYGDKVRFKNLSLYMQLVTSTICSE